MKECGKVIRCICILDQPIPFMKKLTSAQIIIPQGQTGRNSDIYIMVVGSEHAACKQGFSLAIISATVETNDPEKELDVAFSLIPTPLEKFTTVIKL